MGCSCQFAVLLRSDKEGRTHIKQELLHIAILVLLLQIHIPQRVNDKHLAVLGNNPLLRAGRSSTLRLRLGRGTPTPTSRSRSRSRAPPSPARTSGRILGRFLLGITLLHPAHLAVHGYSPTTIVLIHLSLRRRSSGSRGRLTIDTGDAEILAPGRIACIPDIPLDKLLLPFPAHVEREVMRRTTSKDKEPRNHGPETRPIPRVVILGPLPGREAIGDEVIIPLPPGAAQDVGDDAQPSLTVRGALDGGLDLGVGGLFGDVHAVLALLGRLLGLLCALGGELLLDLVRVEGARLLAVGLVDLVLGGRGRYAEEFVKGYFGAFVEV